MKLRILMCAFVLWAAPLIAQENLVLNPDFEEYYDCDYNQVSSLLEEVVPHWWARKTSPLYVNTNCIETVFAPPFDIYHALFHPPFNGDGHLYFGLILRTDDSTGQSRRDLAQTRLKEPLKPGKPYYLEYQVRIAYNYPVPPIAPLGVLLTDSLVLDGFSPQLGVPYYPLVTTPQLQVDTAVGSYDRWTRVSHCFVPDAPHQVMTVGLFAPGDSVQWEESIYYGFVVYFYDAFYLIELEDTLRLSLRPERDTICAGGCVELSSNHSRVPGDFYWELPGSDVGVSTDSVVTACYLEPGEYDVHLEVEHCHGTYGRTFQRAVTVLPRPALPTDPVQRHRVAQGDTLPLSACHGGGQWQVRWSPEGLVSCPDCPSTVFTGQESAVLLAIAEGPCPDTCTYEIEVLPRAEARFEVAQRQACEGGCFRFEGQSLNAGGPARYSFAGSSGQVPASGPFELCAPVPGTYEAVFVVDNAVSSDTFRLAGLEVLAFPERLPADLSLEATAGEEIRLQAGFAAASYEWRPLSGSFELGCTGCPGPTVVPYQSGTLLLTASNGPCRDSLRYDIAVRRQPALMYVPNAFSPNGDGRNDEFRPYGRFFTVRRLQIYDRYGGLLFEAVGPDAAWGGRAADGRPANPGTYAYLVEYEDIQGEALLTSGAVDLLR